MKTLFITVLLYFFVLSNGDGYQDPNICATQCQYCCRNQVCQSQNYCTTGDTNTYAIIGGVIGGIVGLIILRVVYVKVIRPACCKPRKLVESEEPKSRPRPRQENKENPRKKKKQSSVSKAKPKKAGTLTAPRDQGPLVANMDENGSIVSPSKQDLENPPTEKIIDSAPKLDTKGDNSDRPKSKQNLVDPSSQRERQSNSKPGNQRGNERSGERKPSSKKTGEKKPGDKSGQKLSSSNMERSRSKDKTKSSSGMEKSKEKMGNSNMERSRSKDKSSSNKPRKSEGMSKSNVENQV